MKRYWEYLTKLGSKTRIFSKILKNHRQQKDEKIMFLFTKIANVEIPLIRSFFAGFRKMLIRHRKFSIQLFSVVMLVLYSLAASDCWKAIHGNKCYKGTPSPPTNVPAGYTCEVDSIEKLASIRNLIHDSNGHEYRTATTCTIEWKCASSKEGALVLYRTTSPSVNTDYKYRRGEACKKSPQY